jgi:hypothetical protein
MRTIPAKTGNGTPAGDGNGKAHFEKCKKLSEYQNLLFLNDIWWLKF